jgi:hypothetical protein
MRMSKFLAATHIFTNFCENPKNLSRLLSVLSLSRKFVHDHCCCPKSAIILTASKLEAILDFWRGCQDLSQIQWGREGGMRGRIWRADQLPSLLHLKRRVRGGGGKGRSKHVLVLNAPTCIYCSFLLHLSFLYLHSAVEASLNIKKFHRNGTISY